MHNQVSTLHTCRPEPVVIRRPVVGVVRPGLDRVRRLASVRGRADGWRCSHAAASCKRPANQRDDQDDDDDRDQDDPPAAITADGVFSSKARQAIALAKAVITPLGS